MTALVPLLFISMIPIYCNITNFSLHLFVYFFDSKNDDDFIIVGATPINLRKVHMPVSFAFAYAHPLHSVIDRKEQEKYPFLSLRGNTG